jgi:protein gp37
MSKNSAIEWTDHTFNPWEGCQRVGPGCDHCYAETRNARFAGGQAVNWGPGAPRRRTSAANWRKPLAWSAAHEQFFAQHGRRQRVFCASLADVFDNVVDPAWRRDLFDLIELTPNLDWLLLTKRIGNAPAMMIEVAQQLFWMDGLESPRLPPNVWLGATIVNQAEADRDIPKLLAVPAAKRFLSMEPLLGPVDLARATFGAAGAWECCGRDSAPCATSGSCPRRKPSIGLDWVIAGGESGSGARPMHPTWARSLRDQCAAAGVPFLFKQWGEWTPGENVTSQTGTVDIAYWHADEWAFDRENLASFGGHVDDQPDLYRVGKKAAGRLLDGVQHDGFPV